MKYLFKDRLSLICFLLHHPYSISAGSRTTDTKRIVTLPWCELLTTLCVFGAAALKTAANKDYLHYL